jgi:hypothetical protein
MFRCMTLFTLESWIFWRSNATTCNNDVAWSIIWTPFFSLHWWSLTLHYPFRQRLFPWGHLTSKVACDVSFLHHWGRYHFMSWTHPSWQFMALECDFFHVFIIKLFVINMQIIKVQKHGCETSMMESIPCLTILNNIMFNEIDTHKKNNLVHWQVSTQHPFTCVTHIFDERNTSRNWPKCNHYICDYMWLLVICN